MSLFDWDVLTGSAPSARPEDAHDPGGKVRLRLPAGMRGDALFSPCGRYRLTLTRDWSESVVSRRVYALWIGMNPSVAAGDANDPTVAKEIGFTARLLGLTSYVKVNVMDYRATKPRDLLAPGVEPRSSGNLPAIRAAAAGASVVIMACGKLHPRLEKYAVETIDVLRADGRHLWCLGTNGDGSPKHPLYLRNDTQLVRFA